MFSPKLHLVRFGHNDPSLYTGSNIISIKYSSAVVSCAALKNQSSPQRVVLDMDSTDIPAHNGSKESKSV